MSVLLKPCPYDYCQCPGKLIEDLFIADDGQEYVLPRVIGSVCKCAGPLAGMSGDMGRAIAIERWNSRKP